MYKPVMSVKSLHSLMKQVSSARSAVLSTCPVRHSSTAGLNFTLTEEQQSIKDMARKFAREEIAPVAAELDRAGKYPEAIVRKAHELGLLTMHLPESIGGQGCGLVDSCKHASHSSHSDAILP